MNTRFINDDIDIENLISTLEDKLRVSVNEKSILDYMNIIDNMRNSEDRIDMEIHSKYKEKMKMIR